MRFWVYFFFVLFLFVSFVSHQMWFCAIAQKLIPVPPDWVFPSCPHSSDVSNKSSWSYSSSRPCNRLNTLKPSCLVGVMWPNNQLLPSLCWRFRGRKPSRWNSGKSNSNSNTTTPLSRNRLALKTELYVSVYVYFAKEASRAKIICRPISLFTNKWICGYFDNCDIFHIIQTK